MKYKYERKEEVQVPNWALDLFVVVLCEDEQGKWTYQAPAKEVEGCLKAFRYTESSFASFRFGIELETLYDNVRFTHRGTYQYGGEKPEHFEKLPKIYRRQTYTDASADDGGHGI